jgi:hypothetical protein
LLFEIQVFELSKMMELESLTPPAPELPEGLEVIANRFVVYKRNRWISVYWAVVIDTKDQVI